MTQNEMALAAGFRMGRLLAVWAAVLAVSVVYCEFSAIAYDTATVEFGIAMAWCLQVWSVWLCASLLLATGRGRAVLVAWWEGPRSRRWLLLALPATAFLFDWLLGLALHGAGVFEIRDDPVALLFRRAPLYATAALGYALCVAWLARRDRSRAPAAPRAGTITVSSPRGTIELSFEDIEAVIAAENYVEICVGGAQYLHRATLASMHELLAPAGLRRVHRSVLVNPRHVLESLPQRRLRLRSGRVVSVGRTFSRRLDF